MLVRTREEWERIRDRYSISYDLDDFDLTEYSFTDEPTTFPCVVKTRVASQSSPYYATVHCDVFTVEEALELIEFAKSTGLPLHSFAGEGI